MKECENKTMESFIELLYETILDAINEINVSVSEFVNSYKLVNPLNKDKHSQTKEE